MSELPWIEWLHENVRTGRDRPGIVAAMISGGFDPQLAESLHDYVARNMGSRRDESLTSPGNWLAIRHSVRQTDPEWRSVARVERPSATTFLRDYYAANRPVVMTGIVSEWPAFHKWTADYLRALLGEETVEVMAGRTSDPNYEVNSNYHRRTIPFSELIDLAEAPEGGNDVYLTANNRFLERPAAASLLQDFEMPKDYLNPEAWLGRAFLWYGSAGTVTPLHYDTSNILFAQVRGRKRMLLFPPELTPHLRNKVGVYSEVNPERQEDLPGDVLPIEVVVEPGEMLFLPIGWWHHVRSLDPSLSLSFTNFQHPNIYSWDHLK